MAVDLVRDDRLTLQCYACRQTWPWRPPEEPKRSWLGAWLQRLWRPGYRQAEVGQVDTFLLLCPWCGKFNQVALVAEERQGVLTWGRGDKDGR